jgi:hypothetical protein
MAESKVNHEAPDAEDQGSPKRACRSSNRTAVGGASRAPVRECTALKIEVIKLYQSNRLAEHVAAPTAQFKPAPADAGFESFSKLAAETR